MSPTIATQRRALLDGLFPNGIPRLWVPPLTHYTADGSLDRSRIAAHLRHMAPYAGGWLVPGSTGDGWEMTAAEQRDLLDHVLAVAAACGASVLIGVLRTDGEAARRDILDTVAWLRRRAAVDDDQAALRANQVCGFTVCPPSGAERTQQQMLDALAAILSLNLPVALYQLPQVTGNEMSADTVESLATHHANFILLKDTSGHDRVAKAAVRLDGVYLVRGAEGDYAQWLKTTGGPYDGLLLSTANSFAPQLAKVISLLAEGEAQQARLLSNRLSTVVAEVFELVTGLPHGNAFANANKAMDHFMAYGESALGQPAPRLHAGSTIPFAVLRDTAAALQHHGLMPSTGYLSA